MVRSEIRGISLWSASIPASASYTRAACRLARRQESPDVSLMNTGNITDFFCEYRTFRFRPLHLSFSNQ